MSVFTREQDARVREIVRDTVIDLAPVLAQEVARWIVNAQDRRRGNLR